MKISRLMQMATQLLQLNLLCIFFSLPIITLFPSLFALVDATQHVVVSKEDPVEQNLTLFTLYKQCFRTHFKRSYKFALIIIPIIVILWLDFRILAVAPTTPISNMMTFMLALGSIILYVVTSYTLYIYVMTKQTLKHAWMLGLIVTLRNIDLSLALVFFNLVFLLVFLYQTGIGILFLFSIPCYILCRLSTKITHRASFTEVLDQYLNE